MTAFLIKSVGFGSIATAITKLLRRLNDKETKPSSRARFKKQSNRINRIIPIEPVKKNLRVDASQCRRRNVAFIGFFNPERFY